MTDKKNRKFGEIVLDLQAKKLVDPNPISVNELSQNILYGQADGVSEGQSNSFLGRVWDTATQAMQDYALDCVFVEVRYKSTGPFGNNTTDKVFLGRQTCPTPTYSQDAFRVHGSGEIEYLWSVPSRLDAHIVMSERITLALDPEYSELVKMVMDFADGTLYRLAQSFDQDYEDRIKGNA